MSGRAASARSVAWAYRRCASLSWRRTAFAARDESVRALDLVDHEDHRMHAAGKDLLEVLLERGDAAHVARRVLDHDREGLEPDHGVVQSRSEEDVPQPRELLVEGVNQV